MPQLRGDGTDFEDRAHDRRTIAGIGVADEQPVFRPEFSREDGLSGQLVVNVRLSVPYIGSQLTLLRTGVANRSGHGGPRSHAGSDGHQVMHRTGLFGSVGLGKSLGTCAPVG